MPEELGGEIAVRILRQEDVIKEFSDANNPIPIQVVSGMGFILNSVDDFMIRKEYKEEGQVAGGDMLRKCLIQRYSDQPDIFTLKQFIDVLINFNTNIKLKDLLCTACNASGIGREQVSPGDAEIIKDIKASLQLMCENVRLVWGKLLNETSLEKCFVEPEIVEEEMDSYGQRKKKDTGKSVRSYMDLFQSETFGDRIVIEGDPGIGKTTYVNKLALDWTWDEGSENCSDGSRFLQSRFTSVFLIPLRSLNGGRASTFAEAASIQLRNCGSWLNSKYQTSPSECLLILDAFDEYDRSCPEINEIINGLRFPRLELIITTRPSHLKKLQVRNQWLSITGLATPDKRERFLMNQGWDKLEERDMVIYYLSSFGTLWHTPLYLAMLCVLYKAKKVTHFDPQKPGCFYVVVTLFTEHIISRKAKEGTLEKEGSRLKKEERQNLKSYIQKCAIEQFSESNPWMADTLETPSSPSCSEELRDLAGQFGLITIREEDSPLTGECEEIVSFAHQFFVEYYAAVEFGQIFNKHSDKEGLVKKIEEHLDLSASPFSYFLAAQSKEYTAMLLQRQIKGCKNGPYFFEIIVHKFPWLPETQILDDIFKNIQSKALLNLIFHCHFRNLKSFWDLDYVKLLCSITKLKEVALYDTILGYHDQSLDYIISCVTEFELWDCNCEHINLQTSYPDLIRFAYTTISHKWKHNGTVLLKHFPNLLELELWVNFTDESMNLLCDALQNMNQLRKLTLRYCFNDAQSVQHIIQLAKTIETSSLCQNLKEFYFRRNFLDSETESSCEILLKAISKCVQLETLELSECQIKPESLEIIKDILRSSTNLQSNLKKLDIDHLRFIPKGAVSEESLDMWKIDVRTIFPDHIDVTLE